jgi:dihydropteroate synthase
MQLPEHILYKLCKPKRFPILMGILNVTTDSFYDGDKYINLKDAVNKARKLIDDGADIIDIGGESTRPGSQPVAQEVELERVIPVIKEIRRISKIPLSIDTRKAAVAQEAIRSGANIINDISSGSFDEMMVELIAAEKDIGYIIMHMKGEPSTMQIQPEYGDLISEIYDFFETRIIYFVSRGIPLERLMLDPGIGFGKTSEHNLLILNNLKSFNGFGLPLVIGVSRKRFINAISPAEPSDRLAGSLSAGSIATENGASILRVHDVFEHIQFFRIRNAISEVRTR